MVRQALAEPAGPLPKREPGQHQLSAPFRMSWTSSLANPHRLGDMDDVTGEHDSGASYATVRDYIRTRRIAGQLARTAPDQDCPLPLNSARSDAPACGEESSVAKS